MLQADVALYLCVMALGKTKMLRAVKLSECSLHLLDDINASMEDIAIQATTFMCRYYNIPEAATMTEARIKAWLAKTGSKSALKLPKLCSLPPTMGAFNETIKRDNL